METPEAAYDTLEPTSSNLDYPALRNNLLRALDLGEVLILSVYPQEEVDKLIEGQDMPDIFQELEAVTLFRDSRERVMAAVTVRGSNYSEVHVEIGELCVTAFAEWPDQEIALPTSTAQALSLENSQLL